MAEHTLNIKMEQLPLFDLDPHDPAATRAWRLRCIETEVALAGALPLRMVHVGEGVQRIGRFEERIEPKIELEHAALFLFTAGQPDVVRSYREGEITVEEADGRFRAVVTLEYAHGTGRWWSARRRVGTNEVGIGVLHGEWTESEGEGIDALDERLREWIDTTGIELGEAQQRLTPTDDTPSLLMGQATLSARPPLDPKVYAQIVGDMVDRQLMERYPVGFEIFAFHDQQVRHFVLESMRLPCPIEDMVRAVASQGPTDAVALRYPGVAEVDGESYRAVFCAVECAGRRWDRVLALKFGPEGRPVAMQVLEQDRGPVPPEGYWLGVEPKNAELTFFLMNAPMPDAPEG
ncbi:MAG: hypothetical protein KC621_35080 [Myxococcales bacterium]|nr:hypothetical protein [Myxococcales bacterium]